jgi:hypothetical protein
VVLPGEGHLSILDWFGAHLDSLFDQPVINLASRSVDSMHSSTIE